VAEVIVRRLATPASARGLGGGLLGFLRDTWPLLDCRFVRRGLLWRLEGSERFARLAAGRDLGEAEREALAVKVFLEQRPEVP
jgi:hypothetical protein